MLAYVMDASDRIVEIDGPWDEFAVANGAPALTRERVLGTPILNHVSGLELRELTRMLLARVRRGAEVALEFRCDSPSERRYLRMNLSAQPDGRVLCATTLLRAEPRPLQHLLDTGTSRSRDMLVICSWCKKVRLPNRGWVEVEEAIETLALLQEPELPEMTHSICDTCRAGLRSAA